MTRHLLTVAAAVSLVLGLAAAAMRLPATSSQTGVVLAAPGKRLLVLKAAGTSAQVIVYGGWPVAQPISASWRAYHIGPSGSGVGGWIWTSRTLGLLLESGECRPFVAPDGRTPLLGTAAINSFNPAPWKVSFWLLSFPLSWLIAATAVLPATRTIAAWRRRVGQRRADTANTCRVCGYDLRGSPGDPGSRCPECGAERPGPSSAP